MIVSVTDLASYMYCPRALYMQSVIGIREPPSQAMVIGIVKHAVLQEATLDEQATISGISSSSDKESVFSLYSDAYSRALDYQLRRKEGLMKQYGVDSGEVISSIRPLLLNQALKRAGFVFDFASRNNVYGFELWELIFPKVFSEVSVISKDLRLRGRIDRVELFKDACIAYEIKTGRTPDSGVWPSHRVQVAAYSMLASRKFSIPSREGVVDYVSSGSQRKVVLNPYLVSEVVSTTGKVISLLESDEIPAACARSSCICKGSF